MHDRRIDNEVHVFGNDGALFMNAMTWFDHETESAWSQPWGRAIAGELKGVELQLLPFELTTWARWQETHPHSLVMINDIDLVTVGRQRFRPGFVIGLSLGDSSRAYYFADVTDQGVINDTLAGVPVLLWAANNQYHAYSRQLDDQTLTFTWQNDTLMDEQTGSTWDAARGLAVAGPLRGRALQTIPNISSFDWAWSDFYPDSDFYGR